MAQSYDLVVIGSGTAAMVAANRMSSAGRKVAVVDYRPFHERLAVELREREIRVNAVRLGAVDTPMLWETPT